MISRCTFACGLMSLIATNPFALLTYAPARTMSQNRQSSRCDGMDPLVGDGLRAHAHKVADRRVDEERRVVVAVAAARAVDEHDVLAADLRAPAAQLQLMRKHA